jgi:hypothetical protein
MPNDDVTITPDVRICHFKELFKTQDKPFQLSKLDTVRVKTIVNLLCRWGLVEVVDPIKGNAMLQDQIDVISYADKKHYFISHKFKMTRKSKALPVQ